MKPLLSKILLFYQFISLTFKLFTAATSCKSVKSKFISNTLFLFKLLSSITYCYQHKTAGPLAAAAPAAAAGNVTFLML